MGTITISVKDSVEERFRSVVRKTYGKRKGSIGLAVTEAINKWLNDREQEKIAKRQIELLEKGFDLGKILIKSRDELYER